jgi:hypothetical protein
MPPLQFSVTPAIPTAMTSQAIHASYPASRLQYPGYPRQYSRSTDLTGSPYWQADLGAALTVVDRVTIENFNFTSATIAGSINADMSAPLFSSTVSGLGATDPNDGRRKYIQQAGGTLRYIRVTPTVADAGAAFYSLGMLGVWRSWQTLTKNVKPFAMDLVDDGAETLDLGNGGFQIGLPPPIKIVATLEARFYATDATTFAQYRSLAQAPRNRVIVIHEDTTTVTRFWHCRRKSNARISPRDGTTYGIEQLTVEELV